MMAEISSHAVQFDRMHKNKCRQHAHCLQLDQPALHSANRRTHAWQNTITKQLIFIYYKSHTAVHIKTLKNSHKSRQTERKKCSVNKLECARCSVQNKKFKNVLLLQLQRTAMQKLKLHITLTKPHICLLLIFRLIKHYTFNLQAPVLTVNNVKRNTTCSMTAIK